ncbi:MAG: sigma-70 family RNA polymerase sigma factor, partial [Polyangiaceae bacterium]|nr:sigma-70 family RNA polymerase sigma factor [Polyangiaceae bacterium]
MTDDDALVARAKTGDRAAKDDLARVHLPLVGRLVRRYVSAADAEDVAQRAMIRAFDRLDTFRGESSFRSWLHRIAVNVALNHVRDRKREVPGTLDEADLITNTLGTARLVAREAKARLLAALEDLPPKQRQSVELRLFRDLSFSDIAVEMGTSEESAKSNFHHA